MPARKLPLPAFRWNAVAGRYVNVQGRFVARERVQDALDLAIHREALRMDDALRQLRTGHLTLDGWVLTMRESVKLVHLWAAAAAKGGWAQLGPSDYGVIGQALRFHYERLEAFAEEIALGLPLDGRATMRVRMYAEASRKSYHEIASRIALVAGMREERNILQPTAEHCAQCVEVTARGWVPLGTLPLVGTRTCLVRCRCRITYR